MTSALLEPYQRQRTVLLTTFRKNGAPVGTPVSIAVDGDRAYLRTWDTAGKFKRLRRRADVEVQPSTLRGRPTGPKLHGQIRILDGEDAAVARRLLARKYPLLHGITVPLMHRLKRYRTVHLEFLPDADDAAGPDPAPG
jgi:PPOX class probable F420-dependent enzyme